MTRKIVKRSTFFRSKIDYGAIAYSSAKSTLLKTIDTIHNAGIRIALGAYCTSPTESLYCESGEPSLAMRRQYLSLSYAASISANNENPTYKNTFSNRFKTVYESRKKIDPPFYERINRYLANLNITLPDTYPLNIKTHPPWTIPPPVCDTKLTQ